MLLISAFNRRFSSGVCFHFQGKFAFTGNHIIKTDHTVSTKRRLQTKYKSADMVQNAGCISSTIITLFESQIILAEHECCTNWGDCKSNKSNQIKRWFLRRGENRSSRRKTSRSRVENQQTRPTYDAGSGNRTRDTLVEGERSHHYANPAPHKMRSRSKMQTEDCRLSSKCTLTTKAAFFFVRNVLTFDFISYLLPRSNLTMKYPVSCRKYIKL